MKPYILCLLLILPACANSQTYTNQYLIHTKDIITCEVCGFHLGYKYLDGQVVLSIGHSHVTIPTQIADSLIYETKLGRSCEKVRVAQLSELQLMDSVLKIHVKQSHLYESVIENQNAIIESFPKEINILQVEHQKEVTKFKAKLRRVWKVVILESGVIILLVLLL